MGLVIDTSVFIDSIIPKVQGRHEKSKELIKLASSYGLEIFAPKIFVVELAGVLTRFKSEKEVREITKIQEMLEIIEENEIIDTAISVALKTHCSAVDAYFIAAAAVRSSALITNDRIMANNAKRCNIEAYYFIEENKAVLERIKSAKIQ